MPRALSVLIVDDFPTTRAGLRVALASDPIFEIVGEASTGEEALEEARRLLPDVVILDLGIPGIPGMEVAAQIRSEHPDARIVIHTMYADEDTAARAFRAGADAYALKQDPIETVLEAARAVAKGRRWLSPALSTTAFANADRLFESPADPYEALSERECEILRLTAQGLTSREVGAQLEISRRTVEAHRAAIVTKLGLTTHRELVRYALRRRLIT